MRRGYIILIIGIVLAVVIIWGYKAFSFKPREIIARELQGPFRHEQGYCWAASLPSEIFNWWGDSQSQPENSYLILYENGKPLGPAHSLHESIYNQGLGRFSHWGGKLYFSTSDNSDPNVNGRKYSFRVTPPPFNEPLVKTLVYGSLALGLTGGVAGLLLITIFSQSALIKKWLYFMALFNLSLMAFLYVNIVNPLMILGRASHVLIFLLLLIALSSIFVIYHEINSRGWLHGKKRVAFVTITIWSLLGIVILLFEVFFRIFPIYDTSALNPGVKFFWPDYVSYPLNNMGFRDRDFALNKNPHTYRIMVVGDSYTEGAGCSRKQSFPEVLERELNRRLQAAGCASRAEVYNLGRCGANTVEEVQVILKEAPVLKPDLIILAYVINDPEVHPPDIKVFDPPASVAEVHKIFLEKIHSYAYYWIFINFTLFRGSIPPGGDYHVLIHSPNYHGWIKAKEAVSTLSEFIKKNDDDLLAVIFPLFNFDEYPAKYVHIHKQVSAMMQKRDIENIDLLNLYEKNNKNLHVFAFSNRDPHPNAWAHKILGQFLSGLIWERESFKHVRDDYRSNS
jgi:GDSL-like Lipase/Acylhydrolase family